MPRFLLLFLLTLPAAAQTVTVVIQPPASAGNRPITIYAETADTPQQRRQGLSGRDTLDDNKGMLFRYKAETKGICMWMKGTKIPLAALFVKKNSNIDTIAFMQPYTLTTHCAAEDALIKYVLEITKKTGKMVALGSKLIVEK